MTHNQQTSQMALRLVGDTFQTPSAQSLAHCRTASSLSQFCQHHSRFVLLDLILNSPSSTNISPVILQNTKSPLSSFSHPMPHFLIAILFLPQFKPASNKKVTYNSSNATCLVIVGLLHILYFTPSEATRISRLWGWKRWELTNDD